MLPVAKTRLERPVLLTTESSGSEPNFLPEAGGVGDWDGTLPPASGRGSIRSASSMRSYKAAVIPILEIVTTNGVNSNLTRAREKIWQGFVK